MIRINLADGLKKGVLTSTDPVAATVAVTFNTTNKTLTFDSNSNDVHVNTAGNNSIKFDLTVTGGGGSASLAGISFPGTQPSGSFRPAAVFTPAAGTIPGKNPVVNIYGSSQGGNLTVTDNDNAQASSGTEEYEYCLWVRYQPNGTPPPPAEYYATDPKIMNEPPAGG